MRDTTAPRWFMPLAILLVLWSLIGCAACFMQVVTGNVPGAAPEDLALVRAMPLWFNLDYVIATLASLAGAVALVTKSRVALPLFVISSIAVVLQFGYVFAATDSLARKGASAAALPIVIIAIALFEIWLASRARRRGWLR